MTEQTVEQTDEQSSKPPKEHPDAGEKTKEPEKKLSVKERFKKMSRGKKIGFAVILVLCLLGSSWFGYEQYKYESTDDAYVGANATQLAPKVSALVTYVLVQENQTVKAGQILAQLDRKDFEAALESASGALESLQARLVDAETNFHRDQKLLKQGAVSRQQFDHSQADFLSIQRQAQSAQAKLDQARLDLDFTAIRAPTDGQIARRSVDVGMYVSAGTAIFGFVPSDERWVDANYKETQLASIAIGKTATLTVDAIPGRTFTGVVESISPATGATFTLMPPDNATGNFTKVVQRIPVRIRIKNLRPEDFQILQAGLSANVDVIKHSTPEKLPPPPAAVFLSRNIPGPTPPLSMPEVQQAGEAKPGQFD
jgi:membrane fusion protein (multidrug efflux system)